MTRILISLALVASATLVRPAPALAAESYDNCTGFITSLPATITTQGIWCLDRDLSTAISSGTAITVATNNVTIDCNHFKIGGLQAGVGTSTQGIAAYSRLNTTIRNCNIRGFYRGIYLLFGAGHLVEDNRFDANTRSGMFVRAYHSTIRNNIVVDTGGSTYVTGFAAAISVEDGPDVLYNNVVGVSPTGSDGVAYGIYNFVNSEGKIIGNRVGRLAPTGTGAAYGIYNYGGRSVIRDNSLHGPGTAGSTGIYCSNNATTARDNVVVRFETGVSNCLGSSNTVNSN